MKLRTGWLLLFVALLTGCASTAATDSTWDTSGFIEADEVLIAPEIAGRVQQLLVDEGDEVRAGNVLLHLDEDILSAQVDLARGKLEEAQATLAKAKAGARREAIVKAEAQLTLAQTARDAAQQAWLDAQAMRDNPQMLDLQIAAARAQVTVTQKQLDAALLQRDIAEQAWKDYGEVADQLAGVPAPYRPHLPTTYYDVPYQWEQAKAAVEAAQVEYNGARSALNNLLAQRSNPQEAKAAVDAAEARVQSAGAVVAQAQAALAGLKAGATQDQIDVAQAQVDMAQAGLEAAQLQLGKATLAAPSNGIIVARSVQTGELVAPGITALTLANLDQVTLTIYVPGSDLGQVALGQSIHVRVDAFADRIFPGTLVFISDKAEYTPRSVRTPSDRVKLVYAVKIKIANADHALKPGMQAEAQLGK